MHRGGDGGAQPSKVKVAIIRFAVSIKRPYANRMFESSFSILPFAFNFNPRALNSNRFPNDSIAAVRSVSTRRVGGALIQFYI
jgi:hypothetical protein